MWADNFSGAISVLTIASQTTIIEEVLMTTIVGPIVVLVVLMIGLSIPMIVALIS